MSEDGFEGSNNEDLSVDRVESTNSLPVLVEDNNSSSRRQSEFRRGGHLTMHYIAKAFPDDYESMGKEVYEMGNQFFDFFIGKGVEASRRYITDVFLPNVDGEISTIVEILREYGGNRRAGMFGFVVEDVNVEDGITTIHIHIIHDCSYGGSHCRCSFRNKIKPYGHYKPSRKFIKPIYEFNRTDWYDIFIYFFLVKRGERGKYIYINGTSWPAPSDVELVQWRNHEKKYEEQERLAREKGIWHFNDGERQENNFSGRKSNQNLRREFLQEGPSSKRSKYQSKFAKVHAEVQTILREKWPVPLSSVTKLPEFFKNVFLIDPLNKNNVESAIENYGLELNSLKLKDFEQRLLLIEDPLFYPDYNYGSLEESIEIIDNLIRYQCNDDDHQIITFLTALVDLLDRRLPKYNCLTIISPPSSGKGFFFDMICAILCNYGSFGTANKNDLFAFQAAFGKRLIMWNEANYESSETNTLKKLFAGDAATVRKKYHKGDENIARTPIIVNSNHVLNYMLDDTFNERIKVFKWERAEFLESISYKPNPMAFFSLLKKYNINY